jgi:CubicO group peptidase (beta-lactamase class C family)
MASAAEFDAVVAPHVRDGGPGCAVAVRHRGQLVHSQGYGLANLEWNIPIDADTVFRIGSITKQFTAAAILRLVEAGRLAIDDPIERHLPDYPVGARRITIRHLLNHTSGIRSYTGLPQFWTDFSQRDLPMAQMIDVFKDLPPDFEPGERYLYNNSGYLLLGAIVERLSNQDYGAHLADTLFTPLGLTSTRFLHDRPVTARRAAGYERRGREIVNATPLAMTWPHAAGALGSSVNDLLRWDEALRGGQVLSQASYAAMTATNRLNDGETVRYGFGLAIQDYRGRRVIGHGGGINGFLTWLGHVPDEDLTIVVLANLTPFPVQQIAFGLARRALGLEDVTRTALRFTEAELAASAGSYKTDFAPLTFKAEDGGLVADWPTPASRFRPFAADAFFLEKDPEVVLRVSELEDGAFQRVTVEAYGEPVSARRVAEPASAGAP